MKEKYVVQLPNNVQFGADIIEELKGNMLDVMNEDSANPFHYDYKITEDQSNITLTATYNEKRRLSQF